MLFVAGGGTDMLKYQLTGTASQTYGLGDGVGGGFGADTRGRAQGEVLTHEGQPAGWTCTSRAWKRR